MALPLRRRFRSAPSIFFCVGFLALGCVSALKAQTITVLIVYTPAVETALGVNGARALAIQSIDSLNAIMRNSGVSSVSYRLAGNLARKVNYQESINDMSLDLRRLRTPGDGFMDEVHTWRDQVGADLVHLLRFGSAGDVGGIANLSVTWGGAAPVGNAAGGFAVTAHDIAVNAYVFAHEIGHNMGLLHAREDTANDADGLATQDYWFGYRFRSLRTPTQVFNTVMAYDSTSSGLTQSRIPHFSNWQRTYAVTGDRSYATGVRSTGAPIPSYTGIMPQETRGILPVGPSDQARGLRENAPVVAAYRVTPPPASVSASGSWEFPPVRIGSSAVREITLQNQTSSPAVVDALVLPDPVFTTTWTGGAIPPRGAIRVPVIFRPVAAVNYPGGDVAITVGGVLQANVSCKGTGLAAVPPTPPPPAPLLSFAGRWEFSPMRVGLAATRSVTIQNRGSSPVTIDALVMPSAVFTTSWRGGTIPARGSVSVPITFRPTNAEVYAGSVQVTVGGVPVADITCRGTGLR